MSAKRTAGSIGAIAVSAAVAASLWAARAQVSDASWWDGGAEPATQRTPETADIPSGGLARNFTLVGYNPLLDSDQGSSAFDPYIYPAMGIARGSNGDITAAGDCVYVGSLIGYQPALIVDLSNPYRPSVVGAVPDLVPGTSNGIEGIEASGDLLVVNQRYAMGELGFPVPAGLPVTGLAIYDIGTAGTDCRHPRLVARVGYKSATGGVGKNAHSISLWRDPVEPRRVLGIQSFSDEESVDHTDILVLDLTGCPQACNPKIAAKWSARTQYGLDGAGNPRQHTHEAIMSTDGSRIYASQWHDGFILLDSSTLIWTLRSQDSCDPNQVASPDGGADHCIKPLHAGYESRGVALPVVERSHTPIRVPDRPYIFETSESEGPSVAKDSNGRVLQPARIASSCPGSFVRILYVGDKAYYATSAFGAEGQRLPGLRLRGDLYPATLSRFGTDEQKLENCTAQGFRPGTAPAESSWFSPHQALVFPNIAFATYYGAGVRAIDLSDPFILREVGHFINRPVDAVRWASYGITGEPAPAGASPGQVRAQPTVGKPMVFAFSYVISRNGYLVYSDVHSGLYVLKYTGPRYDEIPLQGICLSGNPGASMPGYEPCPPYGRWDSPANAWN